MRPKFHPFLVSISCEWRLNFLLDQFLHLVWSTLWFSPCAKQIKNKFSNERLQLYLLAASSRLHYANSCFKRFLAATHVNTQDLCLTLATEICARLSGAHMSKKPVPIAKIPKFVNLPFALNFKLMSTFRSSSIY